MVGGASTLIRSLSAAKSVEKKTSVKAERPYHVMPSRENHRVIRFWAGPPPHLEADPPGLRVPHNDNDNTCMTP